MIDTAINQDLWMLIVGVFVLIPTLILSRALPFRSNPYTYTALIVAAAIGFMMVTVGVVGLMR